MDYEQGRINNYDWNEPVSKHLEIAYEALQQCIIDNFSPFPTYNPKMTVARHRKTDRRPAVFINKDKESIGLGVAGGDGYWTDGSMSLKDLVNMWNKAQDAEEKNDDAITSEMIEKYDWNEPISKNPELAYYVLEACIERNFPKKSQFDGAFMNGLPPKMEIRRHKTNGEMPKAFIDKNTQQVGIGIQGGYNLWTIGDFTLEDLVTAWNHEQSEGAADDDGDNEITSTAVDSYDWDAPIGVDNKLLADVVQHCLKQQETGNSTTKMHICLCKDCCQPPMVFNKEHQGNTFFGCDNPKHASISINANMSLTEIVNSWNELQGKAANETKEKPTKETSLDVMGRNAFALPQEAKTIDELEAEVDRGLSKPEDVQRLKEANIQQEGDSVNHPSHYTSHPSGIECIQVTEHYDFCIGNAIKYLWRAGLKSEEGMSDKEKEIEDLKKAVWYIQREIQRLEKETEN